MLKELQHYLSDLDWQEGDTPPVVGLDMYFSGNTEEECIAPNQWGDGRPPIAELYAKFKEIASRPDVEKVLVGLHHDWDDPSFGGDYPPAENVHIFTSASKSEVEAWIDGMCTDGVVQGWPYGKPRNAPQPSKEHTVISVCWD